VVGREVSQQPPWSMATSTITEPGFIFWTISVVMSLAPRRLDQDGTDDQIGGRTCRSIEWWVEKMVLSREAKRSSRRRSTSRERSIDDELRIHADGDARRVGPDHGRPDNDGFASA